MPGTPGRPRRTPQRGVAHTLDKENMEPPVAPIDSPGGLMSKRKDRVNRRFSVLKVLGRTETAISPGGGEEDAADSCPAGAAKKRRNSRVSFGHIQTAVFQKDSEHSPSPAGTRKSTLQLNANNLSALPDDTVASGSPASNGGSEDMDITMGAAGTQALASLPPISDMTADTSMASFCDDDADNSSSLEPAQPQQDAPRAPLSLADLVADDEESDQPASTNALEFSANGPIVRSSDRLSCGSDMLKLADVTDHDLTADIKGPGDNTRRLGDHTGAFMAGDQTMVLRQQQSRALHMRSRDSEVMELTTAYGGIVSHAQMADETGDETGAMELTTAYGGIVGGNGAARFKSTASLRVSLAGEQLTGILSKVKGAMGVEDGGGREHERDDKLAMEMRGSFGRILSSAIGAGSADLDATMEEDTMEQEAGGAKTYHDDEVTMFTPLSRIKRQSRSRGAARTDASFDGALDSPQQSVPRTRSRSRSGTPRVSMSADKAVRGSGGGGGGNRRRSLRGAAGAGEAGMVLAGEDKIDTLDKFLEEIGIRFLTNVKPNNHKRKSSVCPPVSTKLADAGPESVSERLQVVLSTGTILGQTDKNCKRLGEMLAVLSDSMGGLEEAVNFKNPAVFGEVEEEHDTDRAVALQKQMKALKKLCRARAESRWVAWREQAQLMIQEALQKNADALADDMRVLQSGLDHTLAAIASCQRGRRAAAVADLAAQLQRLADSEEEQALVVTGLREQVESTAARRQQLVDTVQGLKEVLAAAQEPLQSGDDSMLLAEAPVSANDVASALQVHDALVALSPWTVVKVSSEEWTVDMPRGRRLRVLYAAGAGAITSLYFEDKFEHGAAVRDELEKNLWAASDVEALLQSVRTLQALLVVLPEVCFRVSRITGIVDELQHLAKSFLLERSVSSDGVGVVRAHVLNATSNFKVALRLQLPWHYPAGRIAYESEWLVGDADEELVADVMTRHSCGQQRLTRILKELSGTA